MFLNNLPHNILSTNLIHPAKRNLKLTQVVQEDNLNYLSWSLNKTIGCKYLKRVMLCGLVWHCLKRKYQLQLKCGSIVYLLCLIFVIKRPWVISWTNSDNIGQNSFGFIQELIFSPKTHTPYRKLSIKVEYSLPNLQQGVKVMVSSWSKRSTKSLK